MDNSFLEFFKNGKEIFEMSIDTANSPVFLSDRNMCWGGAFSVSGWCHPAGGLIGDADYDQEAWQGEREKVPNCLEVELQGGSHRNYSRGFFQQIKYWAFNPVLAACEIGRELTETFQHLLSCDEPVHPAPERTWWSAMRGSCK